MNPGTTLVCPEGESALRGGLNSGWYIAVLLRVLTDLVPASYYIYNGQTYQSVDSRFKFGVFIKYSAGLNIGYRYALTNSIFIEGAVGTGYQTYNFKYGDFRVNGILKLAYTF